MFLKIDDTVINTDQIVNIDFDPVAEKTAESTATLFMAEGSKQTFFADTV